MYQQLTLAGQVGHNIFSGLQGQTIVFLHARHKKGQPLKNFYYILFKGIVPPQN